MLRELKFVQGAVGRKEFIPAITHFCIENGTVRAYNGTIALCSPINCDLNVKPKAVPMVQAIARCTDTIALMMTPTGRLSIKSGKYRVNIECVEESQAHVQPEGEFVELNGTELLKGLKAINTFIGSDASRPWSTGVLLSGQSAFATNNICIVEYWMQSAFPRVVNLPRAAVQEMIRLDEAPTHAQVSENSITFHYSDGRWVRSQLYSSEWPNFRQFLDKPCDPKPVPEELFVALDQIKPFRNKLGQAFITPQMLHTHMDVTEGSTYDLQWAPENMVFSLEMLELLEGVAKTADFTQQPCLFFGENLRGAIMRMRMPEARVED